jgi:hypothetical protein
MSQVMNLLTIGTISAGLAKLGYHLSSIDGPELIIRRPNRDRVSTHYELWREIEATAFKPGDHIWGGFHYQFVRSWNAPNPVIMTNKE